MIYQCRKVLKSINYLCKTAETTSSLDISVYFHNHTKHLDLNNTIAYLADKNYITGIEHDGYWDEIYPTYTGAHYISFTLEWFRNSVLFPIIVSLVTSLITNLIF